MTSRVGDGIEVVGARSIEKIDEGWIVTGREVNLSHKLSPVRFYRHGWQSWSMVGWERINAPRTAIATPGLHRQADAPELEGRVDHVGSWVGAVEEPDRTGLLLGSLGIDARVSVADGTITGTAAEEVEWFLSVGSSDGSLDEYGRRLASALGSRSMAPGPLWCTWYSQGRELEASSLRSLIADTSRLPFEVFLVDDGWERAIGDWLPNEAFGEGMGPIAAEIEKAGMRPGLWLAPFTVEASQADRWEGLLIESDDGAPLLAGRNWETQYYGIDLSHPLAMQRVIETLRTAVSWGFTYLKLDFLFTGAIPGRRHRPTPPERVYRLAVEAIRAELGDDVYMNACGAPVVPSVGIFDSIRVGPDVAPFWEDPAYSENRDYSAPGTRRAIATSLGRLWLRPAIGVDPDVAYFRTERMAMTSEQRRFLQDICRLTGFRATSDPPSWLNQAETEALVEYLGFEAEVVREGRYSYRLGDRQVDFGPVVEGAFD